MQYVELFENVKDENLMTVSFASPDLSTLIPVGSNVTYDQYETLNRNRNITVTIIDAPITLNIPDVMSGVIVDNRYEAAIRVAPQNDIFSQSFDFRLTRTGRVYFTRAAAEAAAKQIHDMYGNTANVQSVGYGVIEVSATKWTNAAMFSKVPTTKDECIKTRFDVRTRVTVPTGAELDSKRERILHYVQNCDGSCHKFGREGCTVDEIKEACIISTKSLVAFHLKALIEMELVVQNDKRRILAVRK